MDDLGSSAPVDVPEIVHHDEIKLKQMFAVALHTAIGPTRRRRPDDDDDLGKASATQNKIFDALGARWSSTYLDAHEKAKVSYDMELNWGTPALSEMRKNVLIFLALVKAIRGGCEGLYRTSDAEDGSDVELVDSALLDKYWGIVSVDPAFRSGRGLLLADEPSPPHDRGDRDVAAEWEYNVVNPGPVGLEVIGLLAKQRLLFDGWRIPTGLRSHTRGAQERGTRVRGCQEGCRD